MLPPPSFRGEFRTDADARAVYAESAGIVRSAPLAVAVPADADDVVALVRWAHTAGTPLVPRGSGSSMAAGAVGPGVVVDLSRLDAIGAVDVARRTVRVGPGALRADVEAAAARHGLRFPPDPSSGRYCTVGGMAGTNAAGAHTLKYGATRGWVAALDCVFDDGTRAEVRRGEPVPAGVPALARLAALAPALRAGEREAPAAHAGVRKESSGYATAAWAASGELVDLLVGSEGTLAVFVGLELALAPRPGATASAFATFASLEGAVAGAGAARAAGASACELLDRTFLDVVAGSAHAPSLPEHTEAVLLAEVEADTPAAAEAGAARARRGVRARGRHPRRARARAARRGRAVGGAPRREPDPRAARPRPQVDAVHRGRGRAARAAAGLRARGARRAGAARHARGDLRARGRRARAREPARRRAAPRLGGHGARAPRRGHRPRLRARAAPSPGSTATGGCARRCSTASGRRRCSRGSRP
jgi:FAD/FMN-containing dehydrogenase